jgi:drug/metabolite transporter (DMT)-like permease
MPSQGIMFALMASVFAALDTIFVKLLSPNIHAFEIAFFRSWFGFVMVLPFLLGGRSQIRSTLIPKHALRATIKYLAMVGFFVAVAHAPVSDVTAISLLTPLLSLLGAWLLLKERRNPLHLLIIILGFSGALIIVQPGSAAFNPYLLLAMGGAVGLSSVLLLLKQLTETDSPATVLFWNLAITALISTVPAAFVWSTPTLAQLAILLCQAGLSASGILLMAHAARIGAVSVIAGLDFLRLPIASALVYLVFRESVQTSVWLGGMLIVTAVGLLWIRSEIAKRPQN